VYRLGVQTWLSGVTCPAALPMTSAGIALPFIYPPFAAMVMVPLTVTRLGLRLAGVVPGLAAVAGRHQLRRAAPALATGGHAGALAATTGVVPSACCSNRCPRPSASARST